MAGYLTVGYLSFGCIELADSRKRLACWKSKLSQLVHILFEVS